MNLNMERFQEKLQPVVSMISENRYIKSLMGGMMAAMPATIIGSLAALLKALPIPAYQNFLVSTGISEYLQLPITFTTNILALIFVMCIAFSLATSFDIKGLGPAVIAVISFLIMTPLKIIEEPQVARLIPMDWLGSAGVFSAIIVGFLSTRLYVFIVKKGWTIKMPESVPPFIQESFASLIPGIIITGIFVLLAALFDHTPYGNIHSFIYGLLQAPLQNLGGSFAAVIIVSIITKVLWLFGIHGALVTLSVMMPIWSALDAAQLSAYSAGEALPNIIGLSFFNTYTMAGGTISLAILFLTAKSKRYKILGRLSIVPAIFGITEPIIFGAPLVMNPIFALPFIFSTVISLALGYGATLLGLLPKLSGVTAPTGTPLVVQGLIAGGWRVALFQVFLILFWLLLWYPFFKMADNKALAEEENENNL